jgi:8-oxo-dGTP diphosphatase
MLVVAAAIVAEGRVLVAKRNHPPELAGRWEFPGGRVRPTEPPSAALARECREELGIAVRVGARLGEPVALHTGSEAGQLCLYECAADDDPYPLDHAELRWVTAAELDDLDWLPADRSLVPALARRLVPAPVTEPGRESRAE